MIPTLCQMTSRRDSLERNSVAEALMVVRSARSRLRKMSSPLLLSITWSFEGLESRIEAIAAAAVASEREAM